MSKSKKDEWGKFFIKEKLKTILILLNKELMVASTRDSLLSVKSKKFNLEIGFVRLLPEINRIFLFQKCEETHNRRKAKYFMMEWLQGEFELFIVEPGIRVPKDSLLLIENKK